MLSYRHAFHAGNHADVLKHTILVALLQYLNQKEKPYFYVDTHAGAGCYSLSAESAEKTGEFQTGITRLWGRTDCPPMVQAYLSAVAQFSPVGKLLFYPGSPALAMTQLRPKDKMRLYELHPADAVLLGQTFAHHHDQVQIQQTDGFAGLRAVLPPVTRRALVLIDPSYEMKEDYRAVVHALEESQRRFATGMYAVWYPCLSRRESQTLPERLKASALGDWLDVQFHIDAPGQGALGLQGSGMFILNPPWTLPTLLKETLPFLSKHLDQTGRARYHLEYQIK